MSSSDFEDIAKIQWKNGQIVIATLRAEWSRSAEWCI